MARNKLPVLVFLLLVFFLEKQCIRGRHLIMDIQSHNVHKVQTYGRTLAKETGTVILGRKVNLHGVNINKAAVANTQSPPSTPPSVVIGETQALPPKKVDDFRPTAPGHSPGVGHSLQN
ncbi:hypothetical protein DITRI_Ditri16bG0032200 [Diplodiscus trichospermus]